jgi:hypothetical protein
VNDAWVFWVARRVPGETQVSAISCMRFRGGTHRSGTLRTIDRGYMSNGCISRKTFGATTSCHLGSCAGIYYHLWRLGRVVVPGRRAT